MAAFVKTYSTPFHLLVRLSFIRIAAAGRHTCKCLILAELLNVPGHTRKQDLFTSCDMAIFS